MLATIGFHPGALLKGSVAAAEPGYIIAPRLSSSCCCSEKIEV
jgi:hypothetical protein